MAGEQKERELGREQAHIEALCPPGVPFCALVLAGIQASFQRSCAIELYEGMGAL